MSPAMASPPAGSSATWSTCGALLALAEAREWAKPWAAVQGAGGVGDALVEQLQARGWDCAGYDPAADADSVVEKECHVLVLRGPGRVLTPAAVRRLKCKAVLGAVACQIPEQTDSESRAVLEERSIQYYDAGMLGVNGGDGLNDEEALELGKKNMLLVVHEASVVAQYDTSEKLAFYAEVMGDGTDNIHFGLWDGVDIHEDGAYGEASVNMTNWMWKEAMTIMGKENASTPVRYIDLGSGTGSAGRHIAGGNDAVSVTCLNLCRNQNRENRERAAALGLSKRITVEDGTFDRMPDAWTGTYDGCFSQDAFVHAYSKEEALREACRITNGGGWLVLSDLHCGDGPGVSAEELHTFAQTNMVNDWQTPEEVVATATRAGWTDVRFEDLTSNIRLSFQLMLKKVSKVIASGKHEGVNRGLLTTYETNLKRRVEQVDEGIFKWGAILARKPFEIAFTSPPPVEPVANPMYNFFVGDVKPSTDVLAITILDRMDGEAIAKLPSTLRAIVSLSSGLDHVDMGAAAGAGIKVLQSGCSAITAAVAEYVLGITVLSLRDAFTKIGTPFPSSGWNLSWNVDGVDLHSATIGIIGIGRIGIAFAERLRALTSTARIIYCGRPGERVPEESRLNLENVSLSEVMKEADIVIPLCSLTEETAGLIDETQLALMKPTATLVNAGRGRVVDTDALTRALAEKRIRHAFLDCTAPEPLPSDHALWSMDNVSITPHYATNTTHVRSELVADIPRVLEAAFHAGNANGGLEA